MSNILFGRSITCIAIAKRKCRGSERRETCEAMEYIKCFR
jgi:hypothetical protein